MPIPGTLKRELGPDPEARIDELMTLHGNPYMVALAISWPYVFAVRRYARKYGWRPERIDGRWVWRKRTVEQQHELN